MNTIYQATRSFVQINFLDNNFFTTFFKRHVKVAAIALAIFSSIATCYVIFRYFKAIKLEIDKDKESIRLEGSSRSKRINKDQLSALHDVKKAQQDLKVKKDLEAKQLKAEEEQRTQEALAEIQAQEELQRKQKIEEKRRADREKELEEQRQRIEKQQTQEKLKKTQELEEKRKAEEVKAYSSVSLVPSQNADNLLFSKIDTIFSQVGENIFTQHSFCAKNIFRSQTVAQTKDILKPEEYNKVEKLLTELITKFENKYPSLIRENRLTYGGKVPAYFANVKDESEESRKYRSLIGICNLLKYGPGIIDDFCETKFLGGEHHYLEGKGLQAFKFYTGTVIDLDTDMGPQENDHAALEKGKKLVVKFGVLCGLKPLQGETLSAEDVARQLPQRKLSLPQARGQSLFIHESEDNKDRSNHGIWKRKDPGDGNKTHYYVNIPDDGLVVLATLKFPYLLAELVYHAKASTNGTLPPDFLQDFIDNGLSTMCFNRKIVTFMDFYITWMAKFKGEIKTPEESAKQNIESGKFGKVLLDKLSGQLSSQNLIQVLKVHTLPLDKLIKLIENYPDIENLVPIKDLSQKAWGEKYRDTFAAILIENDLWETTLYRTDEKSDYFLLNERTLNDLLPKLYTLIQTSF